MASYNDSFKFTMRDIDLIEETFRKEISALSVLIQSRAEEASPEMQSCEDRIRKLHELLGKIHNQKIWYGQAHHTGVPLSG